MTRDPLDEALNRSAPAVRPASRRDVDAMIADARNKSSPRRAPRLLIAGAAVAAVLATGMGTAAATDGFSWAPWARDPLGAIPFTMANGFSCELRFSEYAGGADGDYLAEVNGVLRDWYAEGDVLAEVEALIPAARDEADRVRSQIESGAALDELPPGEAEHREWAREWLAWDLAVSYAEGNELQRNGIAPGDDRMAGSERAGQMQCRDLDGQLYVPGAGS